jgi:hypothetical protein
VRTDIGMPQNNCTVMPPSRERADEAIRASWRGRAPQSIAFIVGLHRSGTTFLYESLSRVLPAAKLTVHDVVNFEHLVTGHLTDGGNATREALTRYFSDRHAHTRSNDALPLSPSTAEEYGWILKRRHGSFRSNDRSLPTLRDLTCKLAYIHGEQRALLLKNPWDTAHAPYLAAQFPLARFVFIRREPLEILSSELGNLLHFSGGPDVLLGLLTKDIASTRRLIALFRALRSALGTPLFSRLGVRLLAGDIAMKLESYDAALRAMPRDRTIEISYAELVADPQGVVRSVAAFLELPVSDAIRSLVASRRRDGLSPLVRGREEELLVRLRRPAA